MADKRYVVAPGFAFTSHGTNYGPGDEVTERIFADESSFLGHINAGKIVEAPMGETPAGKGEKAKKGKGGADGADEAASEPAA